MTDTSTEAVDVVCAGLEECANGSNAYTRIGYAELLAFVEALAAERDDERIRADTNAEAHVAAVRLTRLVEAKRDRLAAAWLRVIQTENSCSPTGQPCDAKRCGCKAEQDLLIKDADDAK